MAIRTVQTASPPATMHYVYDLAGHLIAEATAAGVVTREYVWLDDMPLALAADLDTAASQCQNRCRAMAYNRGLLT